MNTLEAFTELVWHENASWKMNISVQNMLSFRQKLIHGKPIPEDLMEEFLKYCYYIKRKDGTWYLPPEKPIMEIEI